MRIEFGIWDHFERRPGIPIPEQYQQKIALLQHAEQLGFYGYHLAEHHLSPLDLAPSPNVFLAALAHATHSLRIGSMVHILPLYHPVRLVQELAMLDNISSGRLEIGIGYGIRTVEHEWFGVDLSEIKQRTDEALQILVSAMSTGNLGFQGAFYQIPDAPLDLLPIQRPYPPLWYAGGIEYAARHRLNLLARTADEVARYWDMVDEHAGSPDQLNAHVATPLAGVTRHLVVRDTDAEAQAVARRAWPVFQHNFAATPMRMPNGRDARARVHDFDAVLAENRALLVGSPGTIRSFLDASLERLQDHPGFYFAPAVQWGDLTYAESLETLRLLSSEVMPAYEPRG